MDDANAPSLLSLPYFGCCTTDDVTYMNTRAFLLSEDNPYFFRGRAGEGIGGPHVGLNMIGLWQLLCGLTSRDDRDSFCFEDAQDDARRDRLHARIF